MTHDFLRYITNQEMTLMQVFTLVAVAYIAFLAMFGFYGFVMVLYSWLKMEDIKGSFMMILSRIFISMSAINAFMDL